MAATASSEGPVMSLINKRLRALRKKYNRITQMEESISQGKTLNSEQEELLRSKPAVIILIQELEKLHAPLSAAVSEEISLAPKHHRSRDLISDLPDEILGKILSLLPTKLVVSTSVLSKRWSNILSFVDNLDFYEPRTRLSAGHGLSGFMQEKFLNSRNPLRIKKFSLNCRYNPNAELWIRTALERGCLELHVQSQYGYFLDLNVFSTNTLVKLTLSDGINVSLYENTPAFYEDMLLENCPVLEELFIRFDDHPIYWNGVAQSESIKRLTISVNHPVGIDFYAPSLVFLDCSCYVRHTSCAYGFHLVSLVEARLDIRIWEPLITYFDDDDDYSLVAKISNVQTLHLSPNSLEVFHLCCKSMPIFNNLLRLSIESDNGKGWQAVPLLLKNSPNLQTLAIKGLVHKITNECGDVCACIPNTSKEVCCLSTCRVKVLEISRYGGTCEELKQMKYFFRKLKCLETVKIGLQKEKNKNYLLRVTNDLKKLHREPNCQLHFL